MIPVVFCTGKCTPYPCSTSWFGEFDDPSVAEKLNGNAFLLMDVTVIPGDEIMPHRRMAALMQKHIHQNDMASIIDRLSILLMADYLSSPPGIGADALFNTGRLIS